MPFSGALEQEYGSSPLSVSARFLEPHFLLVGVVSVGVALIGSLCEGGPIGLTGRVFVIGPGEGDFPPGLWLRNISAKNYSFLSFVQNLPILVSFWTGPWPGFNWSNSAFELTGGGVGVVSVTPKCRVIEKLQQKWLSDNPFFRFWSNYAPLAREGKSNCFSSKVGCSLISFLTGDWK